MNDSYLEILVKKKASIWPMIGRNVLIGLGVLVFLFGFFARVIFLLTLLVAGLFFGGAYLFHKHVSVEYEYLYLDKSLSVDRISNQSTRKHLADYDMEHLEIFAPAESPRLSEFTKEVAKKADYTSHLEDSVPYALVFKQSNHTTKVLVEYSDKLYDQIRMAAPRKVFKD